MAEGAASPSHAQEMKSFPVFRALKWHECRNFSGTVSTDRVAVSVVTSGQRGVTQFRPQSLAVGVIS